LPFNSYEFIFVFLPLTVVVYYLLNKQWGNTAGKIWLAVSSLFFYGCFSVYYLPLILGSILINYLLARGLDQENVQPGKRRGILILGLIFNIGLLGYFKYANFLINNLNYFLSHNINFLQIALPVAISFFTFIQIAYLVDIYRRETRQKSLLDYLLFVSFFPYLLSGPIVRHNEVAEQYDDPALKKPDYSNIASGIFLFSMGLFKKLVIADTLAVWANFGFDTASSLTLIEGWLCSLSYTLQLYFDFSGYTDMALGVALLFNIKLPINFNSPYKADSIQDFWRRWHISLSRFLRDYIYIPLGGSRVGNFKLYRNLLLTFLIGGLWHGAAWTFVFWGFLHGIALVIQRLWRKLNIHMNKFLAWFITFNFVNVAWVFFRADSWADAVKVLKAMLGLSGVRLPESLAGTLGFLSKYNISFGGFLMEEFLHQAAPILLLCLLLVIFAKNSMELKENFKPSPVSAALIATLAVIAILSLTRVSEFIYVNF
jgi:alginate O-acetyltransferase complex protein AlgI